MLCRNIEKSFNIYEKISGVADLTTNQPPQYPVYSYPTHALKDSGVLAFAYSQNPSYSTPNAEDDKNEGYIAMATAQPRLEVAAGHDYEFMAGEDEIGSLTMQKQHLTTQLTSEDSEGYELMTSRDEIKHPTTQGYRIYSELLSENGDEYEFMASSDKKAAGEGMHSKLLTEGDGEGYVSMASRDTKSVAHRDGSKDFSFVASGDDSNPQDCTVDRREGRVGAIISGEDCNMESSLMQCSAYIPASELGVMQARGGAFDPLHLV